MQELVKGKSGNGQRKAYNHIIATDIFGIRTRIEEARKNPYKRKPRRGKRR